MNMKKTIILLAAAALAFQAYPKQAKGSSVLDVSQSFSDSAIIYPESFEADTQKMLESWYLKNYTSTDDRYKTMPDVKVSDDVLIARLQSLPTIIEMPFNQVVKSYIERYTQKSRAQVSAMLGLSHYYMPIFEQALEQEGLPLELKYLPVIESALNPNAVSKHGATGLWQFMLGTAKGLGLEVNSLVDERRDPYMSSEKAASYLKDLYATYGDWSLAIAAYNCGPGAVNKAIRRAGGDPKSHDFWSIYNYLSAETRGYVPMFIAANYVMNYYKDHNISPVLATKPLVTDTIAVTSRIHFNQISNVLNIPVEELRILNPQFRADIIPGSADSPYYLILPSQQVHAYIMSEDEIKNYDADKYAQRLVVEPNQPTIDNTAVVEEPIAAVEEQEEEVVAVKQTARERSNSNSNTQSGGTTIHKVREGESLASIAEQYNVSPADIKTWNGLRRNAVRVGQQLKIEKGSSNKSQTYASNEQQSSTQKQTSQKNTKTTTESSNTVNNSTSKKNSKNEQANNKKNNKKDSKNKKAEKQATPKTHTIKEGENLTVIANKYGVSVNELKSANNIDGDNIRAGKTLQIPSKGSSKKGKSNTSSSSKKKNSSSSSKKKGKKRR
jgi:membrane-bound lytic murein transglycosylase D